MARRGFPEVWSTLWGRAAGAHPAYCDRRPVPGPLEASQAPLLLNADDNDGGDAGASRRVL